MNSTFLIAVIILIAICIIILIAIGIVAIWRKHRRTIIPTGMDNSLQSWQNFYRKYFRMKVDFSQVRVPANPGDFDRILFFPQGLKINHGLKAMLKAMLKAAIKWWIFAGGDDLDNVFTENDRAPTKAYAIRCRERVEADEELVNLSANELKGSGFKCMTLLERIVYGLKYYSETGKHLDVVNVTLCAGSRSSDGEVPRVNFIPGNDRVHVFGCQPDYSFHRLRARQVVS